MDNNKIKLIKALTSMNISLLAGLETVLHMMKKWDTMPNKKKEDIIDSLRLLIDNNKACLFDRPTLH